MWGHLLQCVNKGIIFIIECQARKDIEWKEQEIS